MTRTQRIRTLEGRPDHTHGPGLNYLYGPFGPSESAYIESTAGFSVVPNLVGSERVILDISPWSNRLARPTETFVIEGAQTTVEEPLGEWFEIGTRT